MPKGSLEHLRAPCSMGRNGDDAGHQSGVARREGCRSLALQPTGLGRPPLRVGLNDL
jgi:hypothetical protein